MSRDKKIRILDGSILSFMLIAVICAEAIWPSLICVVVAGIFTLWRESL